MNVSGTQRMKYPYGGNSQASENTKLYRFMGVDLAGFLGKIAKKVILHNPGKWAADAERLYRAALSADPNDRRLIWLVSGNGTHLYTEYETFIEDTPASRHLTRHTQNAPDLFGYIIEVKCIENGIIKGNVFEIGDIEEYAWYVKKTAVPLDSVTLTYENGKSHDIPHYEYARDYKLLMGGNMMVSEVFYHPHTYSIGMDGILHKERENRMALPVGSTAQHLDMLSCKLAGQRGHAQTRPVLRMPARRPAVRQRPSIAAGLLAAERAAKDYNAKQAKNQQLPTKNNNKEI